MTRYRRTRSVRSLYVIAAAGVVWLSDSAAWGQWVETHKLTSADTFYNLNESGGIINSAFDANAPDWSSVTDQIVFWSGQENCFGQVWRIDWRVR